MLDWLTGWLAGDAAEDLVPRYIGFNAPFSPVICVALLVIVGAGIGLYYWRKLAGLKRATRIFLVAMRVVVVVLVLFLALDPSVVAQYIRPSEQFVALMFDDSMSMRIGGREGMTRGDRLRESYAAAQSSFEERLKRRHQVVRYRVGEAAEPLRSMDDLEFDQHESDLLGGVMRAVSDLEGTAISGIVLFSDGVQMSERSSIGIEDLPEGIPVFTVGVDEASQWQDIELARLSLKRMDFDKSPVVATVGVHSTGLAGQQALVEIGIGSRVIKSKLIEIAEDVGDHEVRLEFVPDRAGWIDYEARVRLVENELPEGEPAPEDRIAENNVRRFAVDNRDRTYRVLYVSGRPNWQNKFFRMALEGDKKQLRLSSLIMISNAERKFEFRGKKSTLANPLFEGFEEDRDRPRYDEAVWLRSGLAEDELATGYPTEAKDLFKFDLVIWGDVERDSFTTEQLELTREFVDKRGGTLLLMGGSNSFTEAGFAGTLVEQMLPVLLYQDKSEAEALRIRAPFSVKPTVEGRLTGSWMFSEDEEEDAKLWSELPPWFGLNRFPLVRAGATVMAEIESTKRGAKGIPVFAVQRYGEGKCAILAAGDTWQWQMRNEQDDDRHERFWRQLVRNLVQDVPDSTRLLDKKDRYTQDAEAEFKFLVRDDSFERREAIQCVVTVVTPDGKTISLPVEESIQEAGVYRCVYLPPVPGLYELSLVALDEKGEQVGRLEEAFVVEPDFREFELAQYNGAFLREMAARTGGGHFTLNELDKLAEAIPVPEHLNSEDVLLHLWHLPGFYIALVLLMIAEWYVRRKAGRA